MDVLIWIIFIILSWYLLNIAWLGYGFSLVKNFTNNNYLPQTSFTIIVPFRNEAENLPNLLQSLSNLNYPNHLFEIILVDDSSDVKFNFNAPELEIRIINNIRKTNSPKKDALHTAIAIAKHEWIITTDADCVVSNNWLKIFDQFIQDNKVKMIACGVMCNNERENNFITSFQQLDFLSLQGTTIGSFGNKQAFMCNGANFCYQKSFFEHLNGFQGNENIASGDDVFLLQKAMQKHKDLVLFLKSYESIVKTNPEKTWKKLINQRVRWASKTGNYKGIYSKQLAWCVFVTNITWIMFFGFWLTTCFEVFFLICIILKSAIDTMLLLQANTFFKNKLKYLFLGSLFYPFFSVYIVFLSFKGQYVWKDRVFKNVSSNGR